MASVVEICNHALARVGQPPIVNIEDGDRLSRLCKLHYEPKRDDLLRAYRWKFAIKRASLPKLSSNPEFGYSYQYQQPVDCLRVLSVNELDREFDPDLDPTIWDVEGNTIVTDEASPIKVKYIRQVTDPNTFDASFRTALSAYLAYYFVPSLREVEGNISGALLEEFEYHITKARGINAIEGRPRIRRLSRSRWISGRGMY